MINDGKPDILSFFTNSEPPLTKMSESIETESELYNSDTELTEMTETTEADCDDYLDATISCTQSEVEGCKQEGSSPKESQIKIIKNKSELLDQYMLFINKEYIGERNKSSEIIRYCTKCNTEKTLVHSESIYVCQKCGEFESVIIDSEKPNYKEAIIDTKPGYIWVALKVDMKSILLVQ